MTQTCRHCQSSQTQPFVNLGFAPPSNDYVGTQDLSKPELTFPLRVFVCEACRLVQTEDFADSEAIFRSDYAYFSSTSSSWVAHAAAFCDMATKRFGLGPASHVIEVASNDGYLLRNFHGANIPCLGVEPTGSTAAAARALGLEVLEAFFGEAMAADLPKSDLVIGNNVWAHVPDINDFTRGLARCLKQQGVVSLEFPHLLNLVLHAQFDTIYHEHFSYLSLYSAEQVLSAAGLRVFDVEELATHGGSLRLYACHADAAYEETVAVGQLRQKESRHGLDGDAFYTGFQTKAEQIKDDFWRFLLTAKADGKTVAGYGAAAKGNTLLNFAGIGPDMIPFVCDAAPSKIGKYLPGSHIPILDPSALKDAPPDYLVIFPWNIAAEIKSSLKWMDRTRFVTAVPDLRIQ